MERGPEPRRRSTGSTARAAHTTRTAPSGRRSTVLHRHPGDIVRLLVAAVGLAVFSGVAMGGSLSRSEVDALRLFNDLPRLVTPFAYALLVAGSMPLLAGAAVAAVAVRRDRLAADLVVIAGVGYGAARLVNLITGRPGAHSFSSALPHLHRLSMPWIMAWPGGFPSAAVAVAAGYATAASPYQHRTTTRLAWATVAAIAIARMYAGVDLPVDVAGGVFLGWAAGAIANLVAGTPVRRSDTASVGSALAALAVEASGLERSGHDRTGWSVFRAGVGGTPVVIHVLDREERSADLLFRLWRRLAFRHAHDEVSFASRRRRVEHEALMAILAGRMGVTTPPVLATGAAHGLVMLVEQDAGGVPLTEHPDVAALLPDLWQEIACLHRHRVAHGNLRLERVTVDPRGRLWLRGFDRAMPAASDHELAVDVANLLVASAAAVGSKEAVGAAIEGIGPGAVSSAAPLLQRLAIPARSVGEWRRQGSLLREVRAAVAEATGEQLPPPLQLTRIKPRTLWSLAGAGLAVYLLLPQVGHIDQTLHAVSHARWWWLAASVVPTAATYVAAAIAQMGAVGRPLPLGSMTLVQVAAAFTNRVTPAGTGGLGLNERFLEREGVERTAAIGAVSVNVLAGAVVHFIATMAAIAVLGRAGIGGVKVPPGWWFLVAALVFLVVAGVVVLTPLRHRLLAPIRKSARQLREAMRRPAQAMRLFGGSAGVTVGYALALAAALACFGAHAPLAKVVVVYLGGSAVASVSPTPGALGAVEAALLAGLTGIGVAPGPALAGVLAFRVVTFWTPTIPGLWAFHELQRRRLV